VDIGQGKKSGQKYLLPRFSVGQSFCFKKESYRPLSTFSNSELLGGFMRFVDRSSLLFVIWKKVIKTGNRKLPPGSQRQAAQG
jgi:hypothetical protein